jgi:hypothetical protein
MKFLKKITFFLLLLILHTNAYATRINWGSGFGDDLFDSSGNPLSSSYTFELGTFGSFNANQTNLNDWAANWKPIGIANTSNGLWMPGDQYVSAVTTVNTDGSTDQFPSTAPLDIVAAGSQIFLWVYNTKTINQSTTEWALLTNGFDANPANDWLKPDASSSNTQPDVTWIFDQATTVVFGGLNNIQGPGNFSNTPSTFTIQTHIVPEPGSLALLLIASLPALTRRRRRKA